MSGLNGIEVDTGFQIPLGQERVDPRDKCGLSCSRYASGEQHDESWQRHFRGCLRVEVGECLQTGGQHAAQVFALGERNKWCVDSYVRGSVIKLRREATRMHANEGICGIGWGECNDSEVPHSYSWQLARPSQAVSCPIELTSVNLYSGGAKNLS
ncbi:hypothetical protein GH714_034065 [Hevea brasiliensis]|uniref:Uncharacterized protein n=1 Tax=Hevea brasiliensis TaxID=3981 RepID=A0A6A6K9B6_HEVBR|nr:hypothetical protein GH714_034065 [Hevea brasiliensis]